MAHTITIRHTPGCPNLHLARQRVATALAHLNTSAFQISVEEVTDPDEAARRGFAGSPAILVDGTDPFAPLGGVSAFACRTYRTGAGSDGAPSVDQLVAVLASGPGR